MENIMKYLEVIFYDNDFGFPVEAAVKKVWDWIYGSNAHCLTIFAVPKDHHCLHDGKRTMASLFMNLHKGGALQPMIIRTYQIEDLHAVIEFKTRGLYWKNVDWKKKKPPSLDGAEIFRNLSIDLKFRKNGNFMHKEKHGNNGESLALDLETGEIVTHWPTLIL